MGEGVKCRYGPNMTSVFCCTYAYRAHKEKRYGGDTEAKKTNISFYISGTFDVDVFTMQFVQIDAGRQKREQQNTALLGLVGYGAPKTTREDALSKIRVPEKNYVFDLFWAHLFKVSRFFLATKKVIQYTG